jgi:predicted DNA-binding transcriptional regulator AlpA
MKEPKKPGSLLSRRGIADLLGVSKQRIFALEDGARFPRPVDCIDGNEKLPVWSRREVERFAEKRKA